MGEFHAAVSVLLDAFARGISIIKTQRRRRKNGHIPIDEGSKVAEMHLSKSLKKNRAEVKSAYGKDLDKFGLGFAEGDAEAHSSLSAILFRLNAGFVSVIERFTKGRSSPTDYSVLLNLSNASRLEAISTFQQLSSRLSQSSLILAPTPKPSPSHRRKKKSSTSSHGKRSTHTRSKSAPELLISSTPLGPATPGVGWVRPKTGRKASTDSRSSGSSTPKQRSSPRPLALPAPATRKSPPPPPYQSQVLYIPVPASVPAPISIPALSPVPISTPMIPLLPSAREKRKSIMSFASDSTKLGEIPEHKWARNGILEEGSFHIRPLYPVEPYREPEKPRGRLARLFRR